MISIKNTSQRYGWVTQLFHWSFVVLFFTNYYLVYRREYFTEENPLHLEYILLHKALGIVALFLGVLYVIWRLFNVKPSLPGSTPAYERWLSIGTHHFLILAIIFMPISGYLMSYFGARPTPVFGLFNMPVLEVANQPWRQFFYLFHEWLSFAIIGFVIIHVAGALKHQFYYKDNILRRMLPVKLK